MGRFDGLFAYAYAPDDTENSLCGKLTCENLPADAAPDALYTSVVAFRHLGTAARLSAARAYLASGLAKTTTAADDKTGKGEKLRALGRHRKEKRSFSLTRLVE